MTKTVQVTSFTKLQYEIDQEISAFKMGRARELLNEIDPSSVPVALRAGFGQLCRRAGLDHRALKFFHIWIHDKSVAKLGDHIEYATCLRKVGLVAEARRILRTSPHTPESQLHLSYCHIQEWNYSEAKALLENGLNQSLDPRMEKLVRLNLAASLIFCEDLDKAEFEIRTLLKKFGHESVHLRLMGTLLQAQIDLHINQVERAQKTLLELKNSTAKESGAPQLLIEKWLAIANFRLDPNTIHRQRIDDLRATLRKAQQWETLRGLDMEVALASNDERLGARLYYGTPFPSVRRRLGQSALGPLLPAPYLLYDHRAEQLPTKIIDGLTGENMPFKFGSLQYRGVLHLLSDFYQPWTVYKIFNGLFNDQAFDVVHSLQRVYQLMRRIGVDCDGVKVPLNLTTTRNGYRLRPTSEGGVLLYEKMSFPDVESLIHQILKTKIGGARHFSTREIARYTPLSERQAQRVVHQLAADGRIETINDARKNRRYQI